MGEVFFVGRAVISGDQKRPLPVSIGRRIGREPMLDELDHYRVEPSRAPIIEVEINLIPRQLRNEGPRSIPLYNKGFTRSIYKMTFAGQNRHRERKSRSALRPSQIARSSPARIRVLR